MQTELESIRNVIRSATEKSSISRHIKDISLEPEQDEEGLEFIRVIISIENDDTVDDEALEGLVTSIEDAVAPIDERYPSVRFADAA